MDKEVIIYTKTRCPFCIKLISILKDRKIKFKEIDFIKNPEYKQILITRNGNTPAPQVEMNGTIIFDYTSEEELADRIKDWIKS
jgi:glutaredoxin